MNLFEESFEYMRNILLENVSNDVVYCRRENGSWVKTSTTAVVGHTMFATANENYEAIRVRMYDFLIRAESLGFEPKKGDVVEYTSGLYEVLAPNNEPCWRYSGADNKFYRIHTKFIGVKTNG